MTPHAFPVVRFCTSPRTGYGPKRSSITEVNGGAGFKRAGGICPMIWSIRFTVTRLHNWQLSQTTLLNLVAWEVQNLDLNRATVASLPRWPLAQCASLMMRLVRGWSYGNRIWGSFSGVSGLSCEIRVPTTQHPSLFTGRRVRKWSLIDLGVHSLWASIISIFSASFNIPGVTLDRIPPLKEWDRSADRMRAKAHFTTLKDEHLRHDAVENSVLCTVTAWVPTFLSPVHVNLLWTIA